MWQVNRVLDLQYSMWNVVIRVVNDDEVLPLIPRETSQKFYFKSNRRSAHIMTFDARLIFT